MRVQVLVALSRALFVGDVGMEALNRKIPGVELPRDGVTLWIRFTGVGVVAICARLGSKRECSKCASFLSVDVFDFACACWYGGLRDLANAQMRRILRRTKNHGRTIRADAPSIVSKAFTGHFNRASDRLVNPSYCTVTRNGTKGLSRSVSACPHASTSVLAAEGCVGRVEKTRKGGRRSWGAQKS